jgi:uncharacterized protein YqjF (DUF2071 family)
MKLPASNHPITLCPFDDNRMTVEECHNNVPKCSQCAVMISSVFSVPRPNCKWSDVITTLADFAIITYAVDPAKLQQFLPLDFEPDAYRLADGSTVAFVSAVPFRDLDFRFACASWARFSFGQTNYRAYVKYKGRRCVWFFGTSLATPLVAVPRHLWKLPWHPASMKFDTQWNGGRFTDYRLETRSPGADVSLQLSSLDSSMGTLDGFASEEETAEVLTHPLIGYFRRRDGQLGSYSVWHERLTLKRANVTKASFQLFEQTGLVHRDQPVHSALVQASTEFVVILPPYVVPA